MNSEKVKEIKKALEYAIDMGLVMGKNTMFVNIKLVDILTYINELESENKELKKYKIDWLNSEKMHLQADMEDTEFELASSNRIIEKVSKENQQLKDRIAELEKGNEALSFAVKQGFNDCQTKTLKQFAEMLKGQMNEGEYMGKKYKLSVFRDIDIDEALNDFFVHYSLEPKIKP